MGFVVHSIICYATLTPSPGRIYFKVERLGDVGYAIMGILVTPFICVLVVHFIRIPILNVMLGVITAEITNFFICDLVSETVDRLEKHS